jgi:hypothetical protein
VGKKKSARFQKRAGAFSFATNAGRVRSVSLHGVPGWVDDDFDLSPGTLRAWCEIGKVLSLDETDKWLDEHLASSKKAA